MKERLILRTSVASKLKKRKLYSGTLLAFFGVSILVGLGAMTPPDLLAEWGWLIYLVSLGMIAIGLIPYRHLCRLETSPYELHAVGLESLEYFQNKQKILTVPKSAILNYAYLESEDGKDNGIAFWLTKESQIKVHHATFDAAAFRRNSRETQQADLFFPYFSRRAYEDLKCWWEEKEED
jgi:hypothetical protein